MIEEEACVGGGGAEQSQPQVQHKSLRNLPEMKSPGKHAKGRRGQSDEPSPRGVLEAPTSLGSSADSSDLSSSSNSFSSESSSSSPVTGDQEEDVTSAPPDACGRNEEEAAGGNPAGGTYQWKNMLHNIKKKSMRRFSVIPLLTNYEMVARKNMKKKLAKIKNTTELLMDTQGQLLIPTKPSWRNFDLRELAAATDGFSSENLVGEGGHAKVYKGCLSDGQVVAIKKIINMDKEEEVKVVDFLSELGIIAHINHPNAAKLLGFSIEGGLHLVLEYLPQGSLASMLHGETADLQWKQRYKVVIGIAEGLNYLHHECPRRIIHRDIKASNILLTDDFEAQISDFGLAKWLPENWLHHIVYPIEGTFGYLAPEYFMHGIVDEKTDVFAFGVLLLEVITARHAVDQSRQSLVMWAKPLLEASKMREIADPKLKDKYDSTEMKRAMVTASMCIHHLPNMRPSMQRVVQLLKGEEAPSEIKHKTQAGRGIILDSCDLQDHTSSSYLNDLNRHMQLVME